MWRLGSLAILTLGCPHALGLIVKGFSGIWIDHANNVSPRAHSGVWCPKGPACYTMPRSIKQTPRAPPSCGLRSRHTVLLPATIEDAADHAAFQVSLPVPAISPVPSTTSQGPSAVASAASLLSIVVADLGLKRAFLRAGLTFPPSLAGMMCLFTGFVAFERTAPRATEKIVSLLEPGSAFLARWLPVFFVPTLVILPLSPAPSKANAIKLLFLLFGGWFVSLVSTAAVVSILSSPVPATPSSLNSPASSSPSKPPPVFRASLIKRLGIGAAISGALAVMGASTSIMPAAFTTRPVTQLSMLLTTLFSFTAGTRVPRKISKAVHPVVTCTTVTMITTAIIGGGLGLGFSDMLKAYVTKSRCPVHLGAGDILLGLLGPSVLSFAVQMYRRRALIFQNAKQVAGASLFSATLGLFGTAIVSRSLGLPEALRLASLSRNITSPLAMAICSMLAADTSFAIAIVVITGVIGANFGATVLDAMGFKDPAARGLAQGSSAHGLGTAAMVNEPTAFAFSAVAMALTATTSTILVAIPVVKKALLAVALGASGVLPTS